MNSAKPKHYYIGAAIALAFALLTLLMSREEPPQPLGITSIHGVTLGMGETEALTALEASGFTFLDAPSLTEYASSGGEQSEVAAATSIMPIETRSAEGLLDPEDQAGEYYRIYAAKHQDISVELRLYRDLAVNLWRVAEIRRTVSYLGFSSDIYPSSDEIFAEGFTRAGVTRPACWAATPYVHSALILMDANGTLVDRPHIKTHRPCRLLYESEGQAPGEIAAALILRGDRSLSNRSNLAAFHVTLVDLARAEAVERIEAAIKDAKTPGIGIF